MGLAVEASIGQIAIGVAVIGAEVGNLRLQYAARQRGIDRGGREARVADVELGRGNAHLQRRYS